MLRLIRRCESFVDGYREYCKEFYENDVKWFRPGRMGEQQSDLCSATSPTNPETIDESWFERTAGWYEQKELGIVPGQPQSIHYWAVDGERFIGEFQLRPELTEGVMQGMGSVGYSVRVTEQGKGYGQEILRQGMDRITVTEDGEEQCIRRYWMFL